MYIFKTQDPFLVNRAARVNVDTGDKVKSCNPHIVCAPKLNETTKEKY